MLHPGPRSNPAAGADGSPRGRDSLDRPGRGVYRWLMFENGSQSQARDGTRRPARRLAVAAWIAAPTLLGPVGTAGRDAGAPHEGCARACVERTAWVMGTRLHVVVRHGDRAVATAATEAALREVERLEALLRTWIPDSPMSAVTAAPVGRPTPAPIELVRLLAEAESWARATGRAFEPAVGALVDAWDLRGAGRRPGAAELARALSATGAGAVAADPGAGTVTRSADGAWIDTGAFGKGAALRAAARVLREAGVEAALLDLGGQVLALGREDADADADGWTLAVAHPARRTEPVARLRVRDVSVATSGASERWVEVDGERLGHVIDPRDGRPVAAWGSVTVASADALVADALATALFVLGPDAALAWARGRDDVGVLVAEDRGGRPRLRWNDAMIPWLDGATMSTDP